MIVEKIGEGGGKVPGRRFIEMSAEWLLIELGRKQRELTKMKISHPATTIGRSLSDSRFSTSMKQEWPLCTMSECSPRAKSCAEERLCEMKVL